MAWVSVGFRTNDAVVMGVGGQYGSFGLSYVYDITSTATATSVRTPTKFA